MPVSGAVDLAVPRAAPARAGLVTLSDSAGRFFLPSLPAGSYTLRALRSGHVPAPVRKVVVLPNQDATFTVSLTPLADAAARSGEAKASAEEDAERETQVAAAPQAPLGARGAREAPVRDARRRSARGCAAAGLLPRPISTARSKSWPARPRWAWAPATTASRAA